MISVVIPSLGRKTLQKAVDSTKKALDFAGVDYEIIVVNDSGKELKCDNAFVVDNPGKGIVSALNHGISVANGEWIARMDDDDTCLPNRFCCELKGDINYAPILTKTALGDTAIVGDIDESKVYSFLDYGNVIAHPTVIMRKEIAHYRNGTDGAEDLDLWLTCRENGLKFYKYAKEGVVFSGGSHTPDNYAEIIKGIYTHHNCFGAICADTEIKKSWIVNVSNEITPATKWIAKGMRAVFIDEAINEGLIYSACDKKQATAYYIADGLMPIDFNHSVRPNVDDKELTKMALNGKVISVVLETKDTEYHKLVLSSKKDLEMMSPTVVHVLLSATDRDNGVVEHVENLRDVNVNTLVLKCHVGEPTCKNPNIIFGSSIKDVADKVNERIKTLIEHKVLPSFKAEDTAVGINSRLVLHCHSINLMPKINTEPFDDTILSIHCIPWRQDIMFGREAYKNREKEYEGDDFVEDKVVYQAVDKANKIICVGKEATKWLKKIRPDKDFYEIENVSAVAGIKTVHSGLTGLIIACDGAAKGWDIFKQYWEKYHSLGKLEQLCVIGVDKDRLPDDYNISYIDAKTAPLVLHYIIGADVVISLSNAEVSPYSLLDAKATGRYVIATDVPGNRDVEGVDCFIENENIDQLHEALNNIDLEKTKTVEVNYSKWRNQYLNIYSERSVFE